MTAEACPRNLRCSPRAPARAFVPWREPLGSNGMGRGMEVVAIGPSSELERGSKYERTDSTA
jgi:hypothetical protein